MASYKYGPVRNGGLFVIFEVMGIHIHIHHHTVDEKTIIKLLKHIIMTNAEAIAKLDAQAAQLTKIQTEVQKLIDAANNQGNVSPELEAAINRVQDAIQTVDDQNADATAEESQP